MSRPILVGSFLLLVCGVRLPIVSHVDADVFRWDTGTLIPGTEGIEPGPGVVLSNLSLEYALLSNIDLSGADFSSADLSHANLRGSTLQGANLADATIFGTRLDDTFSLGFQKEQLYSTASYAQKDLREIGLVSQTGGNMLDGWDFSGQNLAGAAFTDCFDEDCFGSSLVGINLLGASLQNANLLLSFGLEASELNAETTYNQGTLLPLFFNPSAAGITRVVSLPGDLDADDLLLANDIDLLTARILGVEVRTWWLPDSMYDLNLDEQINLDDQLFWIHDLKQTFVGDADLDGFFNSSDFVQVFVSGKYETEATAGWAEGDWNADRVFDSNDVVAAFVEGAYETSEATRPAAGILLVPEPSALLLLAIGGILTRMWCRPPRKRPI